MLIELDKQRKALKEAFKIITIAEVFGCNSADYE